MFRTGKEIRCVSDWSEDFYKIAIHLPLFWNINQSNNIVQNNVDINGPFHLEVGDTYGRDRK